MGKFILCGILLVILISFCLGFWLFWKAKRYQKDAVLNRIEAEKARKKAEFLSDMKEGEKLDANDCLDDIDGLIDELGSGSG